MIALSVQLYLQSIWKALHISMVKISARKQKNLNFWISTGKGTQKLGMMLDPVPDSIQIDSDSQLLQCLRIWVLTECKLWVLYNFRSADIVWTDSTSSKSPKMFWRVVLVQQVLWQIKHYLRMQLAKSSSLPQLPHTFVKQKEKMKSVLWLIWQVVVNPQFS